MSSLLSNTNGGQRKATGGGGSSNVDTISITSSVNGTTITNAGLVGLLNTKIVSVSRSGVLYNVVNTAPALLQCLINNVAGTITVNAAEPFFIGEIITIKKLV